ncbi:MAG: hypothetical protein JWN34_2388 [Bryobacterales bacterium]|nr:hypothetical protein [Bryobacterales bacterium]
MNFIFKKQLDRRTFLRGATGAALALPMLDSMIPALFGATGSKAPTRMAFVYFPNGIQENTWSLPLTGEAAALPETLPRVLMPLAPYRSDITILDNLTINGGRALGDGPGDHGRAGASYLTGAHPKRTFGKDLQAGISVDQIAAQSVGGKTRFASLELGGEEGIQGGNCDNGYSCAYSNSISWRTPSTPNPPEVRPRAVFERLFGPADAERDPVKRAKLERYKKSVLDSVLGDAKTLAVSLGKDDRRKLDEYLYAIRDIETRIQSAEQENAALTPNMAAPPSSVPENYTEHSRLMFDLMLAAFQTDSTRIITFLMAIEQSNRNYREIGITDSHHGLTHHGGDKEKIEKCVMINRYETEQFAYFLGKLKATPDGDGTLFDHSMITYGSGLSLGHNHDNVPTLLTGGNHGRFKLGQQVKYKPETPLANLHLMMLDSMGVSVDKFADSNGKLGYLSV